MVQKLHGLGLGNNIRFRFFAIMFTTSRLVVFSCRVFHLGLPVIGHWMAGVEIFMMVAFFLFRFFKLLLLFCMISRWHLGDRFSSNCACEISLYIFLSFSFMWLGCVFWFSAHEFLVTFFSLHSARDTNVQLFLTCIWSSALSQGWGKVHAGEALFKKGNFCVLDCIMAS